MRRKTKKVMLYVFSFSFGCLVSYLFMMTGLAEPKAEVYRTNPAETYVMRPEVYASSTREGQADIQTGQTEEGWSTVVATAYCPCDICCGEWAEDRPEGIVYTASGTVAEEGRTIAADWDIYPPGTRVYIEGLGEMVVEDCGEAIEGGRIDIYFNDHDEALRFGVQELKVRTISKNEEGKKEEDK